MENISVLELSVAINLNFSLGFSNLTEKSIAEV